MRKNIAAIFLSLVLLVAAALYFIYNKPHRDIVNEDPAYSIPLSEIQKEFIADEAAASEKYFNQVIELSGTLVSAEAKGNEIYDVVIKEEGYLASGEIINPSNDLSKVLGDQVKLKGLFIGFDNLLEEIKMSDCSIKYLSNK